MQSLKLFIDYYSKHYPKLLRERRGEIEVEKEIYEERRKLRDYFFNCNVTVEIMQLKKMLPKGPPLHSPFINKN
jgi:hypothetical protein